MSEYSMTENAIIITGESLWDESNGPRPASDESSFTRALHQVRDAIATLNANPGDLGELIEAATPVGNDGYSIAPEVIGQFLMAVLPIPEAGTSRLNLLAKTYWMQVASHMGPDYIAELRRIAAFMDKVDQF